jgi:beta-catenin-like protein 1
MACVLQLDQSILELLVANLARLNEADEESDRTGVFNILGIFDNLLSFLPPLANQVVEQTDLLTWLLRRITVPVYDSNKQYASEVLAVLLQEERTVRLKLDELGGIEPLLQAVAVSCA